MGVPAVPARGPTSFRDGIDALAPFFGPLGAGVALNLRQDGTGSRVVTWPSNIKGAPTLTTTASKVDVLTFACVEVSAAGVPTYRLRASALNQTA